MLETVLASVAITIAIVAAAFAGMQARATAQQASAAAQQLELTNALARVATTNAAAINVQNVYNALLTNPELIPYFYDSAPLPEEGETRGKALVVAEMLADSLSIGLHTIEEISSKEETGLGLWHDYCTYMLKTCPALRAIVDRNPVIWPYLAPLRKAIEQDVDRDPS